MLHLEQSLADARVGSGASQHTRKIALREADSQVGLTTFRDGAAEVFADGHQPGNIVVVGQSFLEALGKPREVAGVLSGKFGQGRAEGNRAQSTGGHALSIHGVEGAYRVAQHDEVFGADRKSTRLNSSHLGISY